MSKYLILTGGSQGIGEATIECFMKAGWKSFNLSRHACQLSDVTNIATDLLSDSWESTLTTSLIPKLSDAEQICLVHNAAMFISDQVGAMQVDALQKTFKLNVIAPALLNNLVLPHMPKGSSIIYIGSTLSEKAVAGCATYTTSKHAIAGLMKATCQDLAGQEIYTCCICPGVTDTEMLRERCNHDDSILQQLKQLSVDERLIEPSEIANVIWFCANNPVMNGTIIHANLGQKEQ